MAAESTEKTRSSLSKEMRTSTRTLHTASDALVNLKLGMTIGDDSVWAEGLLVFYEIFKYLEAAMERLKDSLIGDVVQPGMNRTAAFEEDLAFYYGEKWRDTYVIRPEVQNYLDHLQNIENENPYLLIAYIYHLYMGLFSGGQILRAKRSLSLVKKKAKEGQGNAVTNFGEMTIGPTKLRLREAVNNIGELIDAETREALIRESSMVFILNNKIIGSVNGVGRALLRRSLKLLVILTIVVAIVLFFYYPEHFNAIHNTIRGNTQTQNAPVERGDSSSAEL